MSHYTYIPTNGRRMTTYTFQVVVEPDRDVWHAYCPALVRQGGATWGATREQALTNLREVVELVVADLIETGERLPEPVHVSKEPLVSVTV
jgi:predicted RNase H-like HicB family nuclease